MSGRHGLTVEATDSVQTVIRAFARSTRGRRWIRLGRAASLLAVLVWLAYKVSGIGWQAVWISRPRTPWFYVVWLGLYLQLPLVEALVFRVLWRVPVGRSLLSLVHKRTLNQDVVSGLGEAFFFIWTRRHVGLPARLIVGVLKDNLIASSLASWVSLTVLVLCAAPMLLSAVMADTHPLFVIGAALLAVLLVVLGVRFRRTILTLRPRTVLYLSTVHLGRFLLLVFALQVLQWWVVVPDAPLSLWAGMLVVATVVSRMPFIPAKDLVGIGAILGVMTLPTMYEATVAAMLLTRTAFDKICNLAVAVAHVALERASRTHASGETQDVVP